MDEHIKLAQKIENKPVNKIPARDKEAKTQYLDLSDFYNHSLDDDIHHKPGNTFSELPRGTQFFKKIPFDVRGIVQLSGLNSDEITSLIYPSTVKNIPVGQAANYVHFLHASAWNIDAAEMEIGNYMIRYTDQEEILIPLVYRKNIWDWWGNEMEPGIVPVWRGENERTRERNMHIRLFRLDWANPKPEKIIASIDLLSNKKGPGAFVAAISLT